MSDHKKFLAQLYKDDINIEQSYLRPPEASSTGSIGLDWAIDGGIRKGGFYCFEGPESSGKSLMALNAVAEMIKKDKEAIAIWFDAERTFSYHFLNIFLPNEEDKERVVVRHTNYGNQIFDYFNNTVRGMIADGAKVACCVVDSISSIVDPKEKNLSDTENFVVGGLASYLPKAMRLILQSSKPNLKIGYEGVPWIFISQVRDNLDPNAMYSGEKYTTPGGRAFKHHLDAEILFEKITAKKAKIFDEELKNMNDTAVQVGHRVRARVKKNKFGPPNRVCEFDINYDKGIVNKEIEAADLAIRLGILQKDGNTYFLNGEKIAVGIPKTIEYISEHPEMLAVIKDKMCNKSGVEDVESIGDR